MKRLFFVMAVAVLWSNCSKDAGVFNSDPVLESRGGICTNIPSFKVFEKRVAPGQYTIFADYTVKPCDRTVPVSLNIKVTNFRTKELVIDYSDALLIDRFAFTGPSGLKVGDWYEFKLTVTNAATGEFIESKILSCLIQSRI